MPPEKIKYTMDLTKILVGCGGIFAVIFYAGQMTQLVKEDHRRIDRIEIAVFPTDKERDEAEMQYLRHLKIK
jgi:hypothetical protein